MRFIPTIYLMDGPRATGHQNPRCSEVFRGACFATRMWRGICYKVDGGDLFRRVKIEAGGERPPGLDISEEDESGRISGWVLVSDPEDGSDDRFALSLSWGRGNAVESGTYELCGPGILGNRDGFKYPHFIRHGIDFLGTVPTSRIKLRAYLTESNIEGIVWWRIEEGGLSEPVGKIRADDLGVLRSDLDK